MLLADRLDGLIVTGTEPRAPLLQEEPYWPTLTKVVDWAEEHTVSTIWSCLAAHAAVLHLDSVQRRPLRKKHQGYSSARRLPTTRSSPVVDLDGACRIRDTTIYPSRISFRRTTALSPERLR